MKIPACKICRTPLKPRGNKLMFKCMCDEDLRILLCNNVHNYESNITYLSEDELSRHFIKTVLTYSVEMVR